MNERVSSLPTGTAETASISTVLGKAARVIDITNRVVKLQSGYIYHYAFVMLIGVALIITYFIFAGGGLPR